jgi:MFS family permease
MLGAAHKPGAIPLRPLNLGDIYDGGFRIIRFNPKATVGAAVLVAAVSMAIPVLLTAVLTLLVDLSADRSSDLSDTEAIAAVGTLGSLVVGLVLQSIGVILVTGMIAHVVAAGAIGRRLSLGEAWAATHGSRWRLMGLALLLGLMMAGIVLVYVVAWFVVALTAPTVVVVLFGIVTVPAFVAFLVWWWVRVYYLPVPALMLERIGVTAAIGRGFRLTRNQFWRTLGIGVLTAVVTGVAGSVLAAPFSIGAQIVPYAMENSRYLALVTVVLTALATVVQTAFVTPFTAAVTSLQYLDQRMRKEAYDVELLARAGITSP